MLIKTMHKSNNKSIKYILYIYIIIYDIYIIDNKTDEVMCVLVNNKL